MHLIQINYINSKSLNKFRFLYKISNSLKTQNQNKQLNKIMDLKRLQAQQNQSYIMIALNKQIQALSPIRISYENLSKYHAKIQKDFYSMIQEHEFVLSSLKSNLQNLTVICMRAQEERNDLASELKDKQNDQAKLILDTKNMAQKLESFNQKLILQRQRTQQNTSHKLQLQALTQTIKSHILALQKANQHLLAQQTELNKQIANIKTIISSQQTRKISLIQQNQNLKCSISKVNIKNDDMIDFNRKLSQQIQKKQESVMNLNKIVREYKQKLIQLRSEADKLKNQCEYKLTVIGSEYLAYNELLVHEQNLQKMITEYQEQKAYVNKQNQTLSKEIQGMQRTKAQNLTFKMNSQNHLAELKKNNQLLLSKMEQYCIQDKQIQNLLIRKLTSLEFFSNKLNKKYQMEQNLQIQSILHQENLLFRQKSTNILTLQKVKNENLDQVRLVKSPSSIIQKLKMSGKGLDIKSSAQKLWTKQNNVV